MAITFSTLQQAIGNLHFADQNLLRSAGLKMLSKMYAAYPTQQGGAKLCVLLPHRLGPKDVVRLGEDELIAKQVVVLEMADGRWRKAWPLGSAPQARVTPGTAAARGEAAEVEAEAADEDIGSLEIVEE